MKMASVVINLSKTLSQNFAYSKNVLKLFIKVCKYLKVLFILK